MTWFAREGKIAICVGSVSLTLLLGALLFQYVGGYAPCEMCIWQRWPHGIGAFVGIVGGWLAGPGTLPRRWARPFAYAAIFAIAVSGAIGVFHAGVEWKLWAGPTACTGAGYIPGPGTANVFSVVRCDVPAWTLWGISMAGYNAILSLATALIALVSVRRRRR